MKARENSIQVIEKPKPKIVPELSKTVKRIIGHKTLEAIIRHTEEEEGID